MFASIGLLIIFSGVLCLVAAFFSGLQKGNKKATTNLLLIGGALLLIDYGICSGFNLHIP